MWFEFCQQIFIFLLITTNRDGFIGWDNIAGTSDKDIKSLGGDSKSLNDEGSLLLHSSLIQSQSCGRWFFSCC